MLGGVKACPSACLLLKPAPWKQEHTGHALGKDFAPPRLIFCYLGKAAIIVKNNSFPLQVFFIFIFYYFFQAVLMGRGNKAQPTATQSRTAGAAQISSSHSFILSSRAWASEPLSHLPFHRVGSAACSSGLLQQNVYSLVPSSSQQQKWGCHGALPPPALMGFEGLEKPLRKAGSIVLFCSEGQLGWGD